jgi:hypothetical protein
MSCTDKFNATWKLREGEREKKRGREKEREKKWTEWRVGSFAFGSVDIQSQFPNFKQATITAAQKKAKTLFSYIGHSSAENVDNVKRSHYVTMVDNNRHRSHIAMRPVYAFVEYMFFISLRLYHMLLLSCCLHNW